MTDKQAGRDILNRTPEDAPLNETIEDLRIVPATRSSHAGIATASTKAPGQVDQLINSWVIHNPKQ